MEIIVLSASLSADICQGFIEINIFNYFTVSSNQRIQTKNSNIIYDYN